MKGSTTHSRRDGELVGTVIHVIFAHAWFYTCCKGTIIQTMRRCHVYVTHSRGNKIEEQTLFSRLVSLELVESTLIGQLVNKLKNNHGCMSQGVKYS